MIAPKYLNVAEVVTVVEDHITAGSNTIDLTREGFRN